MRPQPSNPGRGCACHPGHAGTTVLSLSCNPSGWRDQMTAFIGRREFITLLGGAAAVAARGARAAAAVSVIRFPRRMSIPANGRRGGDTHDPSDSSVRHDCTSFRIGFGFCPGANSLHRVFGQIPVRRSQRRGVRAAGYLRNFNQYS